MTARTVGALLLLACVDAEAGADAGAFAAASVSVGAGCSGTAVLPGAECLDPADHGAVAVEVWIALNVSVVTLSGSLPAMIVNWPKNPGDAGAGRR